MQLIKWCLSLFAVLSPYWAMAEGEFRFSTGYGHDTGGLGIKYGYYTPGGHGFYASTGLLQYSSGAGSTFGYSIGYEHLFLDKHALGVGLGRISAASVTTPFSAEKATYDGGYVFYNYYFSGFENRSWVIGLSAYQSDIDRERSIFTPDESGVLVKIGFQW